MIEVHADGSSSGKKNRPIGWGYVVCRDAEIVTAGFGGQDRGTNNVAELRGAIDGLKQIEVLDLYKPGEMVWLISDSQYTLGMAANALHATTNLELVAELQALTAKYRVRTRWVKGHQVKKRGDWTRYSQDALLNFRCDQLAALGRDQFTPEKLKSV